MSLHIIYTAQYNLYQAWQLYHTLRWSRFLVASTARSDTRTIERVHDAEYQPARDERHQI